MSDSDLSIRTTIILLAMHGRNVMQAIEELAISLDAGDDIRETHFHLKRVKKMTEDLHESICATEEHVRTCNDCGIPSLSGEEEPASEETITATFAKKAEALDKANEFVTPEIGDA